MPSPKALLEEKFSQALALHQQGDIESARSMYKEILSLEPLHFDANHLLGVTFLQSGHPDVAQKYIEFALGLYPQYAAAHYNLGCALKKLNKLTEALISFDKAVQIEPGYAEAFLNRANVLHQMGQHELALQSIEQSIALNEKNADAWNNRGNVLQDLKDYEGALSSYSKAIEIRPEFAEAHSNQGVTLKELRRYDEALAQFDTAIRLKPHHADAYNNKAVALQEMKQFQKALEQYDQAIALNGNYAAAFVNRGIVLWELKRLEAARDSYAEGQRLDPNFDFLAGIHLTAKMNISDWQNFDENLSALVLGLKNQKRVCTPFSSLALVDDPELQLAAAELYVAAKYPAPGVETSFRKKSVTDKVRVGYYSADFYRHATAYLMAELFEAHDPEKFEIIAFSFGPNKQDEMRQRVHKAFDQFYDVTQKSDREVAELSRALGIDIAVDLKGFTQDARTGIFAERAAPIQVNYLGYPGTMGASYIDYLIADKTLIPEAYKKFYTEKIVYLPDSYQVNDSKRKISDKIFTRQNLGLPEQGFVFCCFNNNYKIQPKTFDLWMRILKAVPGSVLWLLQDNIPAVKNLKREAQGRGIDSDRLVFAPRMTLEDHLARHRVADLVLDTLPCNAHTTASDALWAGLPVLTIVGHSFAARVGASLLKAVALEELITSKPEAFEEKAIELALNPQKMAAIRDRLRLNLATSPLFNGARFAKHLEAAYQQMLSRHQSGLPPADIEICTTVSAQRSGTEVCAEKEVRVIS